VTNNTPSATNATITAFDTEPSIQALPSATRGIADDALRRVIGPAPAGQVTVVNPAIPATSPASPKKPLIALLAAIAGVLITSLVLLTRMRGNRPAADERALAELEYAYLGAVDVSYTPNAADKVSVEANPTSSTAANYRMLAARLSLVEGGSTTRSLLVVDSTDGSAAAVVAANLAAALARTTGESILLADVSTELGTATKLLGLQGEKGYAELAAQPDLDTLNGKLSEFFVDRGDLLRVLPRGRGSNAGPTSAERARALLRRLRESADLVVLSGPPVSHSPGGLVWARAAESVLFVVDGDKASHDEVMQAANDLSLANANFLGTVIGRRRAALPVLGRAAASRT
jgi:tyrosine-protein kinase Etk/Wzc